MKVATPLVADIGLTGTVKVPVAPATQVTASVKAAIEIALVAEVTTLPKMSSTLTPGGVLRADPALTAPMGSVVKASLLGPAGLTTMALPAAH